jgi:hypothetical protein
VEADRWKQWRASWEKSVRRTWVSCLNMPFSLPRICSDHVSTTLQIHLIESSSILHDSPPYRPYSSLLIHFCFVPCLVTAGLISRAAQPSAPSPAPRTVSAPTPLSVSQGQRRSGSWLLESCRGERHRACISMCASRTRFSWPGSGVESRR